VILSVYIILLILNTVQYFREKTNVKGKVEDMQQRVGLPGTSVMLFNARGEQQDVRLTNRFGDIKFRAEDGTYKVLAYKNGYYMADLVPPSRSVPVSVDQKGFINKSILMKKG
jgi:hypothetical protein